jgi:hypothetical protein
MSVIAICKIINQAMKSRPVPGYTVKQGMELAATLSEVSLDYEWKNNIRVLEAM